MTEDRHDTGNFARSMEATSQGVMRGVEETRDEGVTISDNRSGGGNKSDVRDLSEDVMVEVFSHLPQTDLFEVMLVSRGWYEADFCDFYTFCIS